MKTHINTKKSIFCTANQCIILVMFICLLPSTGWAQLFPFDPYSPAKVYKILNHNSHLALEIGGSGTTPNQKGALANQWPYLGTANQQWIFLPGSSSGTFYMVNRGSGQALEIGGGGSNQNLGANANQWTSLGLISQMWTIINVSGNGTGTTHRIKPTHTSNNLTLEIGGTTVATNTPGTLANQWTYVGTDNQLWDIFEIDPTFTTVIRAFDTPGYVLGSVSGTRVGAPNAAGYGGINEGGTAIARAPYSFYNTYIGEIGLANQQWVLQPATTPGYSVIINRGSGLALEIGGTYANTMAPGAVANQWQYINENNQQWRIQINPDGSHTYFNGRSKMCLELGSDGYVRQNPYVAGSPSQKWLISYPSIYRSTAVPIVGVTNGAPKSALALATSPATNHDAQGSGGLEIYPNPASSILTVALPNAIGVGNVTSVQVTDTHGRVIPTLYLGNGQVDVSNLSSGLYLITVISGQQLYHQKFVKE